MNRWTATLAAATLLTASTPVALAWGAGPTATEPIATGRTATGLIADVNRDGRVTAADEEGEDRWTDTRGAIFLPNLDDDERRCRVDPADLERLGAEVDRKLAACNDAADDRINGPRDAADLAPLAVNAHRTVSRHATGRLSVVPAGKARVFVDGKAVETLTADQLRSGVRAGLEGLDVVRDPARWDGQVSVTLTVADRGRTVTDVVKLQWLL